MNNTALLEKATEGVNALTLDDKTKANTLANLSEWLSDAKYEAYLPQIESLIERGEFDQLSDCFYQLIPFGTGGQRGKVGVGPNRFNDITLTSSIQGHCEYLKQQKEEKGWDSLAVVVAYDVRQFHDLAGVYDPSKPNPVLGLTSRNFGEIAAGVYAANGINVWIQAESEVDALATPELSFIIRHLGAQGGLNVSASHNPPDDNGAKVYNYTGGQEVPPNDERMVKLVDQVDEVKRMDFNEAASAGLVKFFDHTAREEYRKAVLEVSLQPQLRDAVVVFTPLHGAGKSATARVLKDAGFTVHRVESQWGDDEGKFPNVPGRVANPEEPKAMVAAARLAAEKGADIVLATDPDADRFGALVANGQGGFRYLDGNELATLVCHYILDTRKRLGTLPNRPLAIKTEVTAAAITRIGEALGATVIDHLLVGFKYVGDIMRQIDENGEFEGEKFEPSDYLFGCEESHGCLVSTAIRDKDSSGPSLLIAELASECKQRGETVSDYLTEVYRKYGLTRNMQLSIGLAGATGAAQMQEMLTSLRENPVSSVAGVGITEMIDLQNESGRFGPIKSGTDRVSRNVMLHPLENGCRIAVRPSGTEPKCKLYVEGSVNFENTSDFERVRDELDAKMIEVGKAFAAEMLKRAGVNEGDPGVKLAGVAEFEQKKNFDTFWRNAE